MKPGVVVPEVAEKVHRSHALAVVVCVGIVPPDQRIHVPKAAKVIAPAVPDAGLQTSRRRTAPDLISDKVIATAEVPILNVCEVDEAMEIVCVVDVAGMKSEFKILPPET